MNIPLVNNIKFTLPASMKTALYERLDAMYSEEGKEKLKEIYGSQIDARVNTIIARLANGRKYGFNGFTATLKLCEWETLLTAECCCKQSFRQKQLTKHIRKNISQGGPLTEPDAMTAAAFVLRNNFKNRGR